VWICLAGTALELIWLATYALQPLREHSGAFISWMIAAFILCLAGFFALPIEDSRTAILVLGFGLLFRLTVLPAHPDQSEDVYRYLWDARVASRGFDPYAYPPQAAELASLRETAIYRPLNSKPTLTAYPPVSQLLFRLSYGLFGERVAPMKAVFSLLEFSSILLAWGLLRAFGRHQQPLYLLAWNPFFVFEFSHSGHSDSGMIFLTLLSLTLLHRGRNAAGFAAYGAAVLSKLHPALWLPLFLRRAGWKAAAPGTAAASILVLAYFSPESLLAYLRSLLAYVRVFEFNASVYYLLRALQRTFAPEHWQAVLGPSLAVTLLVLVPLLWWRFLVRDVADLLHAAFWIMTVNLCLATTVHPWYLAWAAFALFLFPYGFMAYWTGAVFLSYFAYAYRPVHEPTWVLLAEYMPMYGLMAWEIRRGGPMLERLRAGGWKAARNAPGSDRKSSGRTL